MNRNTKSQRFWQGKGFYLALALVVAGAALTSFLAINGMVEHSVLFRGVKIDKGAHVKNCIIMQDCHIEEGVQLENCILDKQAIIKHDGRLIGPSAYPIVISKNMII